MQYRVPQMFWDDHTDRAPYDHESEAPTELSRKGRCVLIEADSAQHAALLSDARFYAEGNVDDCAGLVRSARAAVMALS